MLMHLTDFSLAPSNSKIQPFLSPCPTFPPLQSRLQHPVWLPQRIQSQSCRPHFIFFLIDNVFFSLLCFQCWFLLAFFCLSPVRFLLLLLLFLWFNFHASFPLSFIDVQLFFLLGARNLANSFRFKDQIPTTSVKSTTAGCHKIFCFLRAKFLHVFLPTGNAYDRDARDYHMLKTLCYMMYHVFV